MPRTTAIRKAKSNSKPKPDRITRSQTSQVTIEQVIAENKQLKVQLSKTKKTLKETRFKQRYADYKLRERTKEYETEVENIKLKHENEMSYFKKQGRRMVREVFSFLNETEVKLLQVAKEHKNTAQIIKSLKQTKDGTPLNKKRLDELVEEVEHMENETAGMRKMIKMIEWASYKSSPTCRDCQKTYEIPEKPEPITVDTKVEVPCCRICFETYSSAVPDRDAKVLLCGHTICRGCANSTCGDKSFINCPICRQISYVLFRNATYLPTNFTVMEVVEKVKYDD